MNSYKTVKQQLSEGILTLTLSRPGKLNAFTVEMADELESAFASASDDDRVQAIIVTGDGDAFCAGMDLSSDGNVFGLDETLAPTLDDMYSRLHDSDIERGVRDTGGRVTLAIFNCNKPVIGAINGPAIGIGATMTLPMDVRLASEQARFGFVFGKIGITPEAASTWFLPRVVGLSRALELVYSADIIGAPVAKSIGLVKDKYPAEELLPAARALAHAFTDRRSAVATALTRQMMYRNSALPHPVEAHRIDSLSMFYTSIGDGREGVRAFLDKREPKFESRISRDMPPFYPWY